ncbi:P1 polyprotein [Soybean yellow shoot virus]|nr:P1 polyprotein [Soybean yellow shoot virus]
MAAMITFGAFVVPLTKEPMKGQKWVAKKSIEEKSMDVPVKAETPYERRLREISESFKNPKYDSVQVMYDANRERAKQAEALKKAQEEKLKREWEISYELQRKNEQKVADDHLLRDFIVDKVRQDIKKAEKLRIKRKKVRQVVRMPVVEASTTQLMGELLQIQKDSNIAIEVVAKRAMKISIEKKGKFTLFKTSLRHTQKHPSRQCTDDIPEDTMFRQLIAAACEATKTYNKGCRRSLFSSEMNYGDSGMIITDDMCVDVQNFNFDNKGVLIVKGRCLETNTIQNALQVHTKEEVDNMLFYGAQQTTHVHLDETPQDERLKQLMQKAHNLDFSAPTRQYGMNILPFVANLTTYGTGVFEWGTRADDVRTVITANYQKFDEEAVKVPLRRMCGEHERLLANQAALVYPTLERNKQNCQGEPISPEPYTDACKSCISVVGSRRKGCKSDFAGRAILSSFISGSACALRSADGDNTITTKLPNLGTFTCSPKSGYCYLTLFLHMFMAIHQSNSKKFTEFINKQVVPSLQQWPKFSDVAVWVHCAIVLFPELSAAPVPVILVHHGTQTMHVIDAQGSKSEAYHMLDVNCMVDIPDMISDAQGTYNDYKVGGIKERVKRIYQVVSDEKHFMHELTSEPLFPMCALSSPTLMRILSNSGVINKVFVHISDMHGNLVDVITALDFMAKKVTRAQSFEEDVQLIVRCLPDVVRMLDQFEGSHLTTQLLTYKMEAILLLEKLRVNQEVVRAGFYAHEIELFRKNEELLIEEYKKLVGASTCLSKLPSIIPSSMRIASFANRIPEVRNSDNSYAISVTRHLKNGRKQMMSRLKEAARDTTAWAYGFVTTVTIKAAKLSFKTMFKSVDFVSVYFMLIGLTTLLVNIKCYLRFRKEDKIKQKVIERKIFLDEWEKSLEHYHNDAKKSDPEKSYTDIQDEFNTKYPSYKKRWTELSTAILNLQSKSSTNAYLKVMAFVTLIMMAFDTARADLLYKTFSQLKCLTGFVGESGTTLRAQNDQEEESSEMQATQQATHIVELLLQEPKAQTGITHMQVTFGEWFSRSVETACITQMVPTGTLVDFTRKTAQTALQQIDAVEGPVILRGFVGSGKSTYLPHLLSRNGKVLLCQPVRVLARNVHTNLQGEPFFQSPSLFMRGVSHIGSGNITVMTAGYALAFYNVNRHRLQEFSYIVLDEAHQRTADVVALNSLIDRVCTTTKVIHASATPLGHESEWKTMKDVQVEYVSALTHAEFAEAQGKGTKADVSTKGDNILVYVASFSEVDRLTRDLMNKGFRCQKVDSRTLTNQQSIICDGNPKNPLYLIATNIVENGVTLDVDVVVDFGTEVSPHLNLYAREIEFRKVQISYGQRIQRNGRVGRFKAGYVLNVGDIPKHRLQFERGVSTEAALKCFAMNIPPPVEDVEDIFYKNVTRKQIETAMQFELNLHLLLPIVNDNGEMSHRMYNILKKYIMKEGHIPFTESHAHMGRKAGWRKLSEYIDVTTHNVDDVYIPFYCHAFSLADYQKLGKELMHMERTPSRVTILEADPHQTLYILNKEPQHLMKTMDTLNRVLLEEKEKLAAIDQFEANSSGLITRVASSFLMVPKRRYQRQVVVDNIRKLEDCSSSLLNLSRVKSNTDEAGLFSMLKDNPDASVLLNMQSEHEQVKALQIRDKYDYSRITKDIISCALIGVAIVIYYFFVIKDELTTTLNMEGKKVDKLRLRDKKMEAGGYAFGGTERDIAEVFGREYVARKEKGKGKKKETKLDKVPKKRSPFQTWYNFSPEDYDLLRIVDAVTGKEVIYDPSANLENVQEDLEDQVEEGTAWADSSIGNRLQAYFESKGIKGDVIKRLKVDLTRHEPLRINGAGAIMGYPEHKGDWRQTGQPILNPESETHNGKIDVQRFLPHIGNIESPNASNNSNSVLQSFQTGSLLITSAHHFKEAREEFKLYSNHGEFSFKRGANVKVTQVKQSDIVVITLPKDVPVTRIVKSFRKPKAGEKVYMIRVRRNKGREIFTVLPGGQAQPKMGNLWAHELSTICGDCGSPVIAQSDFHIIGFHSFNIDGEDTNLFSIVTDDFIQTINNKNVIGTPHNWCFDANSVYTGWRKIRIQYPGDPFPITKVPETVHNLNSQNATQSNRWVAKAIEGNMLCVGTMDNHFSTKHTIQGLNPYFREFLKENQEAMRFFSPYLDQYQPSILSKDSFNKDFFKYCKPTEVGIVNTKIFSVASERVIKHLERAGFNKGKLPYVWDASEVFQDLNQDAAMGAQYSGKKKDYFSEITEEKFELDFVHSIARLMWSSPGVWKGSLKAELRRNEKVLAGKTRVFTAAPYDTLIGAKACVDSFNKLFYKMNTKGPWTVGINKLNRGWHKLLTSLPTGWIYGTGDGSQFDSSLTPFLINEVCTIRRYFQEHDVVGSKCLGNLYHQIIWTLIATPDGSIIMKNKGNNSGQPSTVVDNTLMVMLAVEYALESIGVSFEDSEKVFKYYCNGDDLLFAVEPSAENILNGFSDKFKELGLNFIFEDRTRDITEVEYMSLRGLWCEGILIPKLAPERIVAIVQWVKKKQGREIFDALNAAIMESWGYEPLTHWLRTFYLWILESGFAETLLESITDPIAYHTETAVRNLYLVDDEDFVYDGRYDVEMHFEDKEGVVVLTPQNETAINQGSGGDKKKEPEASSDNGSRDGDKAARNESTQGDEFEELELPEVPSGNKLATTWAKIGDEPIIKPSQLMGYKPPAGSLDVRKCSKAQLEAWRENIKREFNTEDPSSLILGFMVWCIDNGTSAEIFSHQEFRMVTSKGERTYPLRPFQPNNVTLRSIMRHFSNEAILYIMKRRSSDPTYKPAMATKRGIRLPQYYPYCIDFIDENNLTPDQGEIVAQMRIAAVEGGKNRALNTVGGSESSMNLERKTSTDVSARVHSVRGASMDFA